MCDVLYTTLMHIMLGLGSRLGMELKDWLPKSYLLASPILPYYSGETAVQSYNTVLSLAAIQQYSDGFLSVNSNDFQRIGNKYSLRSSNLENFNFVSNKIIRSILCSTCDTISSCSKSKVTNPFSGWDLIAHLFKVPSCKFGFCSASTVPYIHLIPFL
jgi:hypothetical protein